MDAVILAGNTYSSNEDVLEILAKIFVEIGSYYYDTINVYLNKIAEFTFYLVSENN